jgi:hypothetical protein
MDDEFNKLVERLGAYDPVDLAAGVAALLLMPENADRLGRLEVAAAFVAGLRVTGSRPRMSSSRWRKYLNSPPMSDFALVSMEDPFDNPFTEAFTFFGGSFVVFPGIVENATYILRHLMKAIFLAGVPFPDREFQERVKRFSLGVLRVGNALARRAGLERGVPPVDRPGGPIVIPPADRFELLKRAVTFEECELAEILGGLPIETIDILTQEQGASQFNPDPARAWEESLFARPILRCGDRYIVASPGSLLAALRHAVICLAQVMAHVDELSRRYRDAVFDTVRGSMRHLDSEPTPIALPEVEGVAMAEALFSLDRDKAAHVLLCTDELEGYEPNIVFGEWKTEGLSTWIEQRLREVDEYLFARRPGPSGILHLVLFQGVGRSHVSGFDGSRDRDRSRLLVMSAADLETIALLEAADPLVLWKYAGAADAVRDRTRVIQTGALDEFHLYRARDCSYYVSDDPPPTTLRIAAGGAGELRREVQQRYDFHGAEFLGQTSVVEVALLHGDRSVPIYMAPSQVGSRVALLVEALPMPVWIAAPPTLPEPRYGPLYTQAVETVAYWLWQLSPGLEAIGAGLADYFDQVEISVELVPSEAWFGGLESVPSADGDLVRWEVTGPGEMRLEFSPGLVPLLAAPDNSGEREVVRGLLRGLRAILEALWRPSDLPTDAGLDELLDRYAPLGIKKQLLILAGQRNLELDRRGLPDYRKIPSADVVEFLDSLGRHLSENLHLSLGVIADDRRTKILYEAVAFYFRELTRLVASLSPDGLLEWLVGHHERILYEQAHRALTVPTELACFTATPTMVERLRKELPDAASTATASRFLIEFVAAQPPGGTQPITMSVYDRLMALAAEIIDKGFISDAIHFGLADNELSMLPSGRLGIGRGTPYDIGREQYLEVHAKGEIARSQDRFAEHWRVVEEGREKPPEAEIADAAAEKEFGMKLSDLGIFLAEVMNAGLRRKGEPKAAPMSEFLSELERELDWPRTTVEQAFEFFALRPREAFLPPRPFTSEVYPWRFSRSLSYVRKPLLVRPGDREEEIVWGVRHVHAATRYLIDLCVGGRLRARTPEMQQFLSKIRNRDAEEFNTRIANLYRERPDLVVRERVRKIGHLRLVRPTGQDLGDIDVLVIDPPRRQILAIETKDLAVARTPAEMSHELEGLFRGTGSRPAAIDRHLERAAWLREHIPEVLTWLRIPAGNLRRWAVDVLVVVDLEIMSPFIVKSPVRVLPYRELREQMGQ